MLNDNLTLAEVMDRTFSRLAMCKSREEENQAIREMSDHARELGRREGRAAMERFLRRLAGKNGA